jgi:hypothetical protein
MSDIIDGALERIRHAGPSPAKPLPSTALDAAKRTPVFRLQPGMSSDSTLKVILTWRARLGPRMTFLSAGSK